MAAQNPELTFWLIAGLSLLATAYALLRFFGFVRRDRFIQDTPLVRIRSAAQGYVRLEGRASSPVEQAIVSPISGRPCVWWDYQIAEKYQDSKGRTEWRTVDQAQSVTPFVLADADGQCLVGPVGADVTPTTRDIWFGDTPKPLGPPVQAGGLLALEKDYRYTERLITGGAHLSVLGEFRSQSSDTELEQQVHDLLVQWKADQAQLLQRFDRNHDGQIDGAEWDAARTAARAEIEGKMLHSATERISVVSQTRHGEPFLIAPLDEQQLVRRERRYTALSLVMSVVFVVLTAWAVHKALGIHTAI
jgi:hypothetical protein